METRERSGVLSITMVFGCTNFEASRGRSSVPDGSEREQREDGSEKHRVVDMGLESEKKSVRKCGRVVWLW